MSDAPHLRGAGAAILVAFMVIHLQDYFGGATTAFTAAFLALWAVAIALSFLAARIRIPEWDCAASEWIARIGGCASCLLLLVLHMLPSRHTPLTLLWVGMAGALVAAGLLAAGGRAARVSAPLAGAVFLVMITTPVAYQGTPFFVRDSFFHVVAAAAFLFLAVSSALALPARTVLAGSLVAGVLLRIQSIDHHEIDAVHRDMLPLVQYACDAFMDGRNPYSILFWANHDLPLTYLPAMWLTYLPALALGADIRLTNIVATAVIAILVLRWSARRGGEDAGLGPVAVAFVFQPEVFWNAIHGEPIVYWLWVALFLDAVWARSPWRAAITLGPLLAVRHFSLLYLPFASLWFLAGRDGWRRGLARLLLSGTIACTIVMPFWSGHPDSFLYGVYDWLVSYGPSRRPWWDVQIGLAQYFYHAGREALLPRLQASAAGLTALAAIVLTAVALVRRSPQAVRDRAAWLPLVVGYGAFVMLNSMIWKSFLFSALLLVLFSAALCARSEDPPDSLPGPLEQALLAPRRYFPAVALAAALLLLSSLSIARGFVRHRRLGDVAMAARYVATNVLTKGDLLVDWSRVQAGHVRAESLFDGLPVPPGVKRVTRLRAQDLTLHDRIVLFDGFSRFDPARDFPDLVRVTSRRMGRSTLHVLRPPFTLSSGAWRLSQNPGAVTGAVFRSRKPPSYPGRRQGTRFVFEGRPPWNWVGPASIRAAGRPMPCIWAHPADDASLFVTIEVPHAGPAVLVTALDDVGVRPLFSPVRIEAFPPGGSRPIPLTNPDEAGRWFWGLGTIGAGPLVVAVWTERSAMRHFGFDLLLGPGASLP